MGCFLIFDRINGIAHLTPTVKNTRMSVLIVSFESFPEEGKKHTKTTKNKFV